MRFEFGHDESPRSEDLSEAELHELLVRLEFEDRESEVRDHHATVDAVCEATGASRTRVWEILDQIREDDLESRIAMRIREAEEPLFRVERPGHTTSPISTAHIPSRRRTFSTLLDHVKRDHEIKGKASLKETKENRAFEFMAICFGFIVVLLMIYAVVYGVAPRVR
ncbi:MAG TPA: hypothetical protein PKA27_04375 [Fimbriimonadaceae bacterium]|nr:hypothetical protein [Fimbriimonadaceae bacterium]